MLALGEFGYIIIGGATGIGTKVEGEVVVEGVGLCHVAVDDELQVVADAAAGGVDAVFICDLCHEVGRGVDLASVDKLGRVEVAVDGWAYGVGGHLASGYGEAVEGAVGLALAGIVYGVEVDESGAIGVGYVFGHGKGEGEAACPDAVGTMVDDAFAVIIGEGFLGLSLIVLLAGHQFAHIAHGGCHHSVEVLCLLDVAGYARHLTHLQTGIGGHGHTVDAVNDGGHGGQIERHGGVAEEGKLQLVDGDILSGGHHLVLGQTLRLAEGGGASVGHGEHVAQVSHIERTVVEGLHGARGTPEGYGSALGIAYGGLAYRGLDTVEGHDVARCRNPQGQIGIARLFKVVDGHHPLMRQLLGAAVAAVVHDERTGSHLLLHILRSAGIGVAGGRRLALVCVPHHLLDMIARMERSHLLGSHVDILHVDILVAVVSHKHEHVLPCAGIAVGHVGLYLVYHALGCLGCGHGYASHGDILLVAGNIGAFAIVHQREETVVHVAIELTERVLTLVTQQIVVGIETAGVADEHAVVPHGVAEEQQIARHIAFGLGAVVEHLEVMAVGAGIGRSAGELVEELVGRNDGHAHAVALLMEALDALGLGKQLLTGGDNDDHVGRTVGMVVLVGNVVDVIGDGDIARQAGSRTR